MEFDWTTFALEILNFIVLVWLLKRFFYKPVSEAIENRRKKIDDALRAAEQARTAAEALKTRYDQRLKGLAEEERKASRKFDDELRAERERRLAALETELKAARDKERALAERETREREAALTREALGKGAKFASELLSALASPELDGRLLNLLVQGLPRDGREEPAARGMRSAWSNAGTPPVLATAHPLDPAARQRIQAALESSMGKPGAPLEFRTDPSLVGGAQLRLGTIALGASLQDELRYFREAFHAE